MKKLFASIKYYLLELLFPAACLNCQAMGSWLCADCQSQLKLNSREPAGAPPTPQLDAVFVASDYRQPLLARLIKKFKYNFLSSLKQPLGQFLIAFWSELAENFPSTLLVVPLPLAPARESWRGFNQAKLLAIELSSHFSYPLNHDLKRVRHCPPQATLDATERRRNIAGAFVWNGGDLRGRAVLLVDDVIASGATINEAARILRAAGAKKIYGLTLAGN